MRIFIFLIYSMLGLISCNQKSIKTNSKSITTTNQIIIDTTITNDNGQKLILSFDNSKQIVKISFNNETFELQRDKTGSGIQYSNNIYQYNNWQNITTLKKDRKLIFEANSKNK